MLLYNFIIEQREKWRTDFSNEFLRDLSLQVGHDHDPRNWIGSNCGISHARAFEITDDRIADGSIVSDLKQPAE